ncbi:hypothetical protein [Sphingobium nicotianae]|uniref:Uncharacterized protein n=1 Tax=Sphingobium nicotianae TaxID=2782607 RepID=A0A9X1IS17_9SPHN|nr:hypothetical protein [Sphingobium nicotianae]MBT2187695.1 hypothetical protein [Sphingobium nicotianae]
MIAKALLLGACLLAPATAAIAEPDFSGSWERYPPMGEKADPRYAPSPIPDPQLKPQYRAEWERGQKILKERLEEGQPAGDNYVHCIPDGMPSMMMGMFPMEVFQRAKQINITQEAFNQTRRIYMNETLPRWDEVDPSFYGRSVGHWEGDTLVVETTGIKANVTFRWTPHSEAMKITERIRLLAPDILQDQITIEDDYLEKPWTYSYSFRRMKGYRLQEYVCEDNREVVDEDGKTHLKIDR